MRTYIFVAKGSNGEKVILLSIANDETTAFNQVVDNHPNFTDFKCRAWLSAGSLYSNAR